MNNNNNNFANIGEDKDILSLKKSCDEFIEKNDYVNALSIAERLVMNRGQIEDWTTQAICQSLLEYHEDAIETYLIKKHGRKAKSIFRYGFDYLRHIFLNLEENETDFRHSLQFLSCT